ncbi:liver-expressed antimicrobial peptide 2 [Protopterus annectens]|uniref:liver-expressed antimicrobial peptide 2 n=1 Tax=Protopterus annectens TaxID=7888 RepID=UPI001CF99C2C|nr:liver-expressed antimicrobial peptide 2 [Protopterus annectens]
MSSQVLKTTVIILIVSTIINQINCAALQTDAGHSAVRLKRMTPFWRFFTLRPVGDLCRDHSECSSKLCKKNYCTQRTPVLNGNSGA